MAYYDTSLNTPISIPLEIDYQDNGWSLSDGAANHLQFNSGEIRLDVFRTIPSRRYFLSFTISEISNGSFRYRVGPDVSEDITSAGSYIREISSPINSYVYFWSDANMTISDVSITDVEERSSTYIFNSRNMSFGGERTYYPEAMSSFLDSFFTFRDGEMWKHNTNPDPVNFYGEKHASEIKIVFNPDPTAVKNMKNIRLVGSHAWEVSEVRVRPRHGKKNGQVSRIKKDRFNEIQGQWYADFLRDMSDPRFQNTIQALFEGAELQGEVVEITMTLTSDYIFRLTAIDIEYSANMLSF